VEIVIAVVDDDQSVREALTSLLKSMGYCPVAFPSAEDFLNSRQSHGAACLIADVQMPGMSGPELHDQLVARSEAIPTILVTAYPDEAARARALRAGVKGYLAKPFNEDVICSDVSASLSVHSLKTSEARRFWRPKARFARITGSASRVRIKRPFSPPRRQSTGASLLFGP
jgi:FixJ family two-component response regulator